MGLVDIREASPSRTVNKQIAKLGLEMIEPASISIS